jgi:hypothetical protein
MRFEFVSLFVFRHIVFSSFFFTLKGQCFVLATADEWKRKQTKKENVKAKLKGKA